MLMPIALLFAASVVSTAARFVYLFTQWIFLIAYALCVVGFYLGWIRSGQRPGLHRRRSVQVCGLLSLAALAMLGWIRHRWLLAPFSPDWPRAWPYPDKLLLAFHDWLDAQIPAEPHLIKLHGEFYTVLYFIYTVGTAILGLICFYAGVMIGGLVPRKWRGSDVAEAIEALPQNSTNECGDRRSSFRF